MKKAGEFIITDSFQLTGRGLVAMGEILEGQVKTGQKILLEIEGEKFLLQIAGVDIGKHKGDESHFIGLHIRNENQNTYIDLNTVKLKPQKAEIFE